MFICLKNQDELKEVDSEKDAHRVISAIFNSGDKKKPMLPLYGRGVSSTQLRKKDMMKEVEKKHAEEIEIVRKGYEDKRQEDRTEIANGLRSFFSQFKQHNPHMNFDLSMLDSLFLGGLSEKDAQSGHNTTQMLQSLASTSTQVYPSL